MLHVIVEGTVVRRAADKYEAEDVMLEEVLKHVARLQRGRRHYVEAFTAYWEGGEYGAVVSQLDVIVQEHGRLSVRGKNLLAKGARSAEGHNGAQCGRCW
jgi:hypothetical protein